MPEKSRKRPTKKFQYNILQPICDRVACPSAPTLQTHIREANELEPIKDINTKTWKFPYDYYAKLNYKLFGDYAKYIKRFESKFSNF